jgi:hypothetical protein
MQLCPNCAAEIIPGARFCHRCGDKIAERTKACPACRENNPFASVFCHHCGFHFEGKEAERAAYIPRYPLSFDTGEVTEQIKALFFRSLRQRVGEEFDPLRYSEFVERFYQSRFREIYAVRAEQIAKEAQADWERFGRTGLAEIDRRIDASFDGLLDYFAIQYCPDLGGLALPEAILKYERAEPSNTDMPTMMADYLAFQREKERVYTDFIAMDAIVLENACRSFLKASRDEKLYFLCDLSAKNSGKEGFAMSNQALYWKSPFDRPRAVHYAQLNQLSRKKDHLTINSLFFSVNPSLDLKMYKLLKKLRSWYATQN